MSRVGSAMHSKDKIKIYNGSVILPEGIIRDGCVIIKNDKIESVKNRNVKTTDCIEIDAGGNYISPGFIDIHTHGAGGHDFMDGTPEAFIGIAVKHAQYGTTSLVPTATTGSFQDLKNMLDACDSAKKAEL